MSVLLGTCRVASSRDIIVQAHAVFQSLVHFLLGQDVPLLQHAPNVLL